MAKAKDVSTDIVTDGSDMVRVELLDSAIGSTHTVYTTFGPVVFVDGAAMVEPDVASELTDAGLLK